MSKLITFDAPPDDDALAAFHPTIAAWFRERLGAPSAPQARGWPRIRAGENVLIAAPTGSGKTLAAFLAGIDALLREGDELPRATRILYISPLRALSNDVQKNLQRPLAELRERDATLPEVRVLVRTGDTPASERQAMSKRHPHILVTTPESLSILLTSEGGRAMLGGVQTVIIDEIHALARDKRGVHLALSLERLEALVTRNDPAAGLQRIGLSATQRPIEDVASFLVGVGRPCVVVDGGHRRDLDLEIVVPGSPIEAVCSHETWGEIYHLISTLIQQHTTTLVFVNTRTLAERIAARLTELLGADEVASHHGSLSRELRLDAEQRLKAGKLRALVATASLELGIDIGDVDLVIQVGSSRSIATLLQRVGRSGHALGKTPKGRMFPLTRDELVEAAGVLRAVRLGELDRIVMSRKPLDILAQQIVSECVARAWNVQALFEQLTRAWPYRDLDRADFDAAWALHTHTGKSTPDPVPEPELVGAAVGEQARAPSGYENPEGGPDIARPTTARGRLALLHHDGTTGVLRATKRARLVVVSSGGAIPDTADYQVQVEPEGVVVGTLFEDFAIESSAGDIFQLGNTSWQILRVEPGVVRVADAKGAPPTIPFWVGEAPARTAELSAVVSTLREEVVTRASESGSPPEGVARAVAWLEEAAGVRPDAGEQIVEYLVAGAKALGTMPTQERLVLERFFDESGGTQLVLHAPFGGRINRALGLALRKRFCVGFGFELQAAANEEAIIFSLGQQHSFPIEEVYDYLKGPTAEKVLVQALLQAPMFETRWRWNATRSLLVERARAGKKIPPPIVRMRAGDLLAAAFPQAAACPETLPPGPLEVPDHPIVRQTVEDCLTEAMDRGGFLQVVDGLQKGRIARVAVDSPEPSILAHGILTAQPYTFLDDAPLEERRTHAVMARRGLDVRQQDGIGALDTAAIDRVRDEAWPQPTSADEVHEALAWIGYLTEREAQPWAAWVAELERARRIRRTDGPIVAVPGAPEDGTVGPRWISADVPGSGDTLDALRGRLEGLGPVVCADPRMLELEREGTVLRVRFEGKDGWCHRRLLARVQRYTVERLRREIEPVTAADFLRFLARWQRVETEQRLEGPKGLATVLRQLSGFEVPAVEWERSVLPSRVKGYRRDWLDQLTLSGEFAWGRLWGEVEPGAASATSLRLAPLCFVSRDELAVWSDLAGPSALVTAAPVEPAPKVPVEGLRKLGPTEAPTPAPAPAEATASGASEPVRRLVALLEARGAQFQDDLARLLGLDAQALELALGEAVARGLATCDGFGAARGLIVPAGRRVAPVRSFGRWSRFRGAPEALPPPVPVDRGDAALAAAAQAAAAVDVVDGVCKALLRRWGVVFKRLLTREQLPIPWRELARRFRILEMRGELRGGRFVNGFSGEQWALPEAVEQLRALRRSPPAEVVTVAAADPLNLRGILTPDERVPRTSRKRVIVGPDPEQTPSVKPPSEEPPPG